MKMRGILVVFVMALCEIAGAQSPTVKPTPASETLVKTAKEMATNKVNFQNALNQARTTLDASVKQLQEEVNAKTKAVYDELKADKKYKDKMAEVDTLQKQLAGLNSTQNTKFQTETMPIQQTISKDSALVDGLIPIVRKENDFPDSATFDPETQTWKGTDKKSEVEPKKE